MKKISLVLILLFSVSSFAYVGGLRPLTLEEREKIDQIPRLTTITDKELPSKVDNSELNFFRGIFAQVHGECAQAAGIGYVYTYEVNRLRDTNALVEENQYPTHYTYNYLNYYPWPVQEGTFELNHGGSWWFDGWDIITAGGCPNFVDYGGMWPSENTNTRETIWMNGFDNYNTALEDYRVITYETIDMRFKPDDDDPKNEEEEIDDPDKQKNRLEKLKHWLDNRGNGSETGGIAVFAANPPGVDDKDYVKTITKSQIEVPPYLGQKIIHSWVEYVVFYTYEDGVTDSLPDHAMTIVGYDDDVWYEDRNDDGRISNYDLDGNLLPLRDWEKGAFKVANSDGTSWANHGFIWMPYRIMALPHEENGIWRRSVWIIKELEKASPDLKLKATIDYSVRATIKVIAGLSLDINAVAPDEDKIIEFPHFNFQGGNQEMKGSESDPVIPDPTILEFGLDISELLNGIEPNSNMKIFLGVVQDNQEQYVDANGQPIYNQNGSGEIVSFSVINQYGLEYANDISVEIATGTTTYSSVGLSKNLYVNNDHGSDENNGTSPNTAFKTISKAIQASAETGSIINLAPGIYDLSEDSGVISEGLNISKSVTVIGKSPETTIVQASENINSSITRVFYIGGNDSRNLNVVLNNLTIRNGVAAQGGGVLADNPEKLTIINCIIENNVASSSGGGVFLNSGSYDILATSIINNFSKQSGGGVRIASSLEDDEYLFKNSTFSGNTSESGEGHGLHIQKTKNSKTEFNSCTFVDNYAAGSPTAGNGIFINSSGTNAVISILNSIIAANGGANMNDPSNITFNRSYTISDDNSMPIPAGTSGNLNNTDPMITGLKNVDGHFVHKILPYSPAKDAIPADDNYNGAGDLQVDGDGNPLLDDHGRPLVLDQLGNPVHNQKKDIGAYESPYYWIHQDGDKEHYTTDPDDMLLHIADKDEGWIDFIELYDGGEFRVKDGTNIIFKEKESEEDADEYRVLFESGSKITVLPNSSASIKADLGDVYSTVVLADNSNLTLTDGTRLKMLPSGGYSLDMKANSSFSVGKESDFILTPETSSIFSSGSEIIVKDGGTFTAKGAVLTSATAWEGISAENGSSISLNGTTLENAVTGISGSPERCIVSNSEFVNCGAGIYLESVSYSSDWNPDVSARITGSSFTNCGSGLVMYDSFNRDLDTSKMRASGNSFTGCGTGIALLYSQSFPVYDNTFTDCGNGIKSTISVCPIYNNNITGGSTGILLERAYGFVRNNSIFNSGKGIGIVSCSPSLLGNNIRDNYYSGLKLAGYNAFPVLVNLDEMPDVNNNIIGNGIGGDGADDGAQIVITKQSNIYLGNVADGEEFGGYNNIYFEKLPGGVSARELDIPCIKTYGGEDDNGTVTPLNSKLLIMAELNFWGSDKVTKGFFSITSDYDLDYIPYSSAEFPNEGAMVIGPPPGVGQGSRRFAARLLREALLFESSSEYSEAEAAYNSIITDYPDSPESYIALGTLPVLSTFTGSDTDKLLSSYNDKLNDSKKWDNKQFIESAVVSTYLRSEKFDNAIILSEDMKQRATSESEIQAIETDISIARLLKELRSGKNSSDSRDIILNYLGVKQQNINFALNAEAIIPERTELFQNYPNPFNPVTQINFALAKIADVKLSVYNISGQLVSQLANGTLNAGHHAVDFDGSRLNSGIYYYTLEADGKAMTKRMVLVK